MKKTTSQKIQSKSNGGHSSGRIPQSSLERQYEMPGAEGVAGMGEHSARGAGMESPVRESGTRAEAETPSSQMRGTGDGGDMPSPQMSDTARGGEMPSSGMGGGPGAGTSGAVEGYFGSTGPGQRRVLVELRAAATRGLGAASVGATLADAAGFRVDDSYEPVPVTRTGDSHRGGLAEAEPTVLIRGIIDESQRRQEGIRGSTSPRSGRTSRVLAALALCTGLAANFPLSATAAWVPQGPGPALNGQTEGITSPQGLNPVSGAIQGIAVVPGDANTIYVATTNGGVWKQPTRLPRHRHGDL